MLKKIIVAVLACLTIFLSKRAMTEPQLHSGADRQGRAAAAESAHDTEGGSASRPVRTASAF